MKELTKIGYDFNQSDKKVSIRLKKKLCLKKIIFTKAFDLVSKF